MEPSRLDTKLFRDKTCLFPYFVKSSHSFSLLVRIYVKTWTFLRNYNIYLQQRIIAAPAPTVQSHNVTSEYNARQRDLAIKFELALRRNDMHLKLVRTHSHRASASVLTLENESGTHFQVIASVTVWIAKLWIYDINSGRQCWCWRLVWTHLKLF